jgi:hypothetical protein
MANHEQPGDNGRDERERRGDREDRDPVGTKYRSLGGRNSFLGSPLGPERTLPDGGRYVEFQGGVIYWSPDFGAFEVHGAILAKWSGLARQAGVLGYPVTDEADTGSQDGGRFNEFERGIVHWTSQLGPRETHGAIGEHWRRLGGRAFGLPITDETAVADGIGRFNDFTGGGSIYWTPDTAAHAIYGAIRDEWVALGGATDVLGYPTTDEAADQQGQRVQDFQGASLVWSAEKGTHLRVLVDLATGAAIWRTPAALNFAANQDDDTGKLNFNVDIGWAPGSRPTRAVITRMVVPTPRVRFGPFYLSVGPGLTGRQPVVCTIIVLARSPALYLKRPDGAYHFRGASADLVEIGRASATFPSDGIADREIYLEATLPGVFNALQLRASVNGGGFAGRTISFPVGCGSVPLEAAAPQKLDHPCLQVAVNPLGMVVPRIVPLTIIYEPPGACSWANATDTHTAGAALTLTEGQSTSTHTIRDTELLGFSLDHADFSEDKSSETERKSEVRVTTSDSLGTRLGLPRGSPPDCEPAPLDRRGPGKGDLFVFLVDPPALFWDSDNMSNFLFAEAAQSPPGMTPQFEAAFAWQLASNQGLPAGLDLSDEDRKAILSLDPFTDPGLQFEERGGFRWPRLPKRFVLLTRRPIGLGAGVGFDSETMRQVLTAGSIRTAIRDSTTGSETEDLDLPVRLVLTGLTLELAAAGGYAAGAAVEALGKRYWSDLTEKELTDLAGTAKSKVLDAFPQLFTQSSGTTTIATYSQSRQVARMDEHAVTQRFFLQDRDQGMTVAIYYDTFFGTFAFAPLQPVTA